MLDRSRATPGSRPRAAAFLAALLLAAALPAAAAPSVSAGNRHVLALGADGVVRAWGDDSSGQLGLGRALLVTAPARVAGLAGIDRISSGQTHVVALARDGSVWAWGENTLGQLGDGTRTSRASPAPVPGLAGVVAVSAGNGHTLALKADGSVWSWGMNYQGQLGRDDDNALVPARVAGLPAIAAVSAGGGHSLALARDGTVWGWGANDAGQLGDGTIAAPYEGRSQPRQAVALAGVVAISAGWRHGVALKADGTVMVWGDNYAGQLGAGATGNTGTPFAVAGLAGVRSVAAGLFHTLALLADGTVRAWGDGWAGQLGDGRSTPSATPVTVAGLADVAEIAAGNFLSMARTRDGVVHAWGQNGVGQLGDGTTTDRPSPVAVSGLPAAASIAAGGNHGFAVAADGRAYAWGSNDFGEAGDGVRTLRSTPAVVPGATRVTAVAAGGLHSLALRDDGTVLAWGGNGLGQLGDGTGTSRSTPAAVPGLAGVQAIAAGYYHSMALKSDGTVWMWGYGYDGQLGNGTNDSVSRPAQVEGLSRIAAIASGPSHVLALATDGTLWAWGGNGSGQLGDGSTVQRTRPVRVSGATGLQDIRAIAAGEAHSLALAATGAVWSWGGNYFGELGDGSEADRGLPGRVAELSGIRAIAAGAGFSQAVGADGLLWAWGANWARQVGDGSWLERRTPVPVREAGTVAMASAGGQHGVALTADGSVRAWGTNLDGRLGDGTFIDRATPVVVLREGGAGSLAGGDWFLDLDPGAASAIPADKVPVFLVTASGAAGDITADIRFRPQDVGTTGSVYVFALAPATIVQGGASAKALRVGVARGPAAKAEVPVACVLAQLSQAGQMVAVTADQLNAYLTGVLSAQGASVAILNGVPIVNVTGATFFVGYGPGGASMLNGGLNRSTVTIPGSLTCAPQPPQTGWWWNPLEDGRGFSLEVRGSNVFFAAFLYDPSGRSTWHVSTGPASLDGTYYSGDLLAASGGQTLGGAYPGFPALATVGRVTLAFNNANTGTLVWPGGTVPIQRFNIVPNGLDLAPVAGQPESGWWWNEQEAGRGFFMEWQGGNLDIAGYMYDDAGNPVWYLTTGPIGGTPAARSFAGNWWSFGGGQTLTGPWKPNTRTSDNVAPVTIQFSSPETALMTLPNGRTTSLRRHRF